MPTPAIGSVPPAFCSLLPAIFLALAACSAPLEVGLPPEYRGPVACVEQGGAANFFRFWTEAEAFLDIESVDGSADASTYVMLPGRHCFAVETHRNAHGFRGEVTMTVPEGDHVLLARSCDGHFDVLLLHAHDRQVVASQRVRATVVKPLFWLLVFLSSPIF